MPSRILTYLVVGVLMAAAFIGISRWITAAIDEPVQEIIRQITRADLPAGFVRVADGPKTEYTLQEQAQLVQVASAVGALISCELTHELPGAGELAAAGYRRLNAIFKDAEPETEMAAIAALTLEVMNFSGNKRQFMGTKVVKGAVQPTMTPAVGAKACKIVAAYLKKQMQPGGIVGFEPAATAKGQDS